MTILIDAKWICKYYLLKMAINIGWLSFNNAYLQFYVSFLILDSCYYDSDDDMEMFQELYMDEDE